MSSHRLSYLNHLIIRHYSLLFYKGHNDLWQVKILKCLAELIEVQGSELIIDQHLLQMVHVIDY